MTSVAYLPFLIQAVLAAVIAGGVVVASNLLGQRAKRTLIKDQPTSAASRRGDRAHALFGEVLRHGAAFHAFRPGGRDPDPLGFVYRDFLANHIAILCPVLFFIGVLVLGLFYEIKKGALEWETVSRRPRAFRGPFARAAE